MLAEWVLVIRERQAVSGQFTTENTENTEIGKGRVSGSRSGPFPFWSGLCGLCALCGSFLAGPRASAGRCVR
jgi:hypothetical protein